MCTEYILFTFSACHCVFYAGIEISPDQVGSLVEPVMPGMSLPSEKKKRK
jgi:hypothetical protein